MANTNNKLLYKSISFENSSQQNEVFLGIDKENNKYFYKLPIINNELVKYRTNIVRISKYNHPEITNYFLGFGDQPDFWTNMEQILYKTPFTNLQFLTLSDYINGLESLIHTYKSLNYGSFIKRISGTFLDSILNQKYKPDPEFAQEFFNKKVLPVYDGLLDLITVYYQQNTLSKEEFENWLYQ